MSTSHSQIKNKKAPNISLNLAVSRNTWELYIAAFFGILVQVTVLVIAGLASYHPGWKLTKGGTSVQDYAYRESLPLFAYNLLAFILDIC
jgi:Mn2+/Fe2+ NRAMP family transporter